MGLLHKVRILMGALVHKPFAPGPEKADLGKDEQRRQETEPSQASEGMETAGQTGLEGDRVADLISKRAAEKES